MDVLVLARIGAPRRHRSLGAPSSRLPPDAGGLSDNLGMGRLSAELRIPVPGRTTAEVTSQLQAARRLGAGPRKRLLARQHPDGSFDLHVSQDRGSNYPVLRAMVEDHSGTTVLRGPVRESRQRRLNGRIVQFWTFLMAVMAVPFVATKDWPGAAICGLGAAASLVVIVLRSRERRPLFDAGVEQLRWAIGRTLEIDPRTTIAALDPELAAEVSAAMSALAGRVDAGATDAECLFELQNVAGLLRRSVPGDFVSGPRRAAGDLDAPAVPRRRARWTGGNPARASRRGTFASPPDGSPAAR